MGHLVWLVHFHALRVRNEFGRGGAFIWVKSLGGLVFGILFLLWVYFLFGRVLQYFTSLQLLGGVLAERLLSLLSLTVSTLTIFDLPVTGSATVATSPRSMRIF